MSDGDAFANFAVASVVAVLVFIGTNSICLMIASWIVTDGICSISDRLRKLSP